MPSVLCEIHKSLGNRRLVKFVVKGDNLESLDALEKVC